MYLLDDFKYQNERIIEINPIQIDFEFTFLTFSI